MKKVTTLMVLIGIIATTFAGCTTTRYGVNIANVPNVSEVFIRNAGTTSWGLNIAGRLDNFDRTVFSDTVDVRVVDTNGIVHSRYNTPFGEAAFVETRTNYSGVGTSVLWSGILIGALVAVLVLVDFDTNAAMSTIGGIR